MARLDRGNSNRIVEIRRSKLHWLVWINIALTIGLYVLLLMGK